MYLGETGAAGTQGPDLPPAPWRTRLKRVVLLALMSVLTLNIFVGSPLLSLWVGSRAQGSGPPSMAGFLTFAVTLGAGSFVLVRLLSAASRAHDALVGRQPTVRKHVPWLRSLGGERPREAGDGVGVSALEAIMITGVILVVLAFEIWFFFYSTSPIDERSGRE